MSGRRLLGAVGAALAMSFGVAETAQAAGGQFSCRGSAARVVTFGEPPLATVEPVRANVNGTPCSDQSAETLAPTTIGPIKADAVSAYTHYRPGTLPSVASAAVVSKPRIELPGLTIEIDAVEAHASATCTTTTALPGLASSSKVVNLRINGSPIALPPNNEPFTLDLSPAAKLVLNEKVTSTPGVVTQRAVHLIVFGSNDIVAGEAIAGTATGNPCEGIHPPGPGEPPGSGVCPPGSTFDAARNACIIIGPDGRVIVISRPFDVGNGRIGNANGPVARCGRLRTVRFVKSRKRRLTQRTKTNDRAVVRGRLVSCQKRRKSIVGARLDVVHIIRGKRVPMKTGLKTRAKGRFTLILPRNIRTRTIEIRYRGDLTKRKVSSRSRLRHRLISSRTGKVLYPRKPRR